MKNRGQYGLLVVLAIVSGFTGGIIPSLIFSGDPVFAQKQETHLKVLRAEKFELVDQDGKTHAELGPFFDQPNLRFYQQDGKLRAIMGLGPEESPVLAFFDPENNLRAGLGLTANGEPKLNLEHRDFKMRNWLPWKQFEPSRTSKK